MSSYGGGTLRLSELKVIEVGVLAGGPETLLAKYLRQRVKSFTFIENLHTRYYEPGMDFLHVSHYREGKLEKSFKIGAGWSLLLKWRKTRRILYYILVMSGILLSVFRLRTKYDLFIAIDSPYPFSGLILRKLRLVKRVFSIIGDHFPLQERKQLSTFFSWFYEHTDELAQNNSEAVWYFTSRLIDINRNEGVIKNESVPRLVVPIGIDMEMRRNEPESNIERTSIGYIGRLNEEIGMELVLESMEDIVNAVPGVTLKIIGSGDNEQALKTMVHEKCLDDNVVFYGFMSDRDKAKEILSGCAVSIAPYVPDVAYSIRYTDPAKVKEYIECGTPVIMTKVPELATEINEKKAGFAVEYNREEMTDAILKLLTDDELWHEYRKNIGQLADRYDYVKLYDEAFTASGIELKEARIKKLVKILITNPTFEHTYECEGNQGTRAIMSCTVKSLKEVIPQAEISTLIQFSNEFADEYKFRVVRGNIFSFRPFSFWQSLLASFNLILAGLWNIMHSMKMDIKILLFGRKLKEFYKTDIIIHLGTNLYSEDFGIRGFIEHSKELLLAMLLKKPIVMYSESIGPFNSALSKFVAKSLLNRIDLITLRDEVSREHLVGLGVKKTLVYLTADPAFLLKPTSEDRISEILSSEGVKTGARPVIGVTLSSTTNLKEETKKSIILALVSFIYMLSRYFLPESIIKVALRIFRSIGYFDRFKSRYVTQIEESIIIDHIIENLDVDIIIVPHIRQEGIFDDSNTAQEIRREAKNQGRIKMIQNIYTSEELKGIIRTCDMFISSRMHAAIAAMSQCIPTILIPVSQRHHGIMRMMGQEKYVCNSFTFDEVIPKVEDAWSNRETIKLEMQSRIKDIQEASLRNSELVRDLLYDQLGLYRMSNFKT